MVAPSVEAILAGPRGRRMLLQFALESERQQGLDGTNQSLTFAAFAASYQLDPGRGTSVVLFGPNAQELERTVIPPEQIARRLEAIRLVTVTPARLRAALMHAGDFARYWQEPDGTDVLAALPDVRATLRRVAEHIATSPHAEWWTTGIARDDQWSVTLKDDRPGGNPRGAPVSLKAWRNDMLEKERRAQRERPTNPEANMSGEWWSSPPAGLVNSTRSLFDRSPAGLWFVEDHPGWRHATTHRVRVPVRVPVFEIDTPEAWAELCRRYPLQVTAQKRHDWYRTTGRNGHWVMPDWSLVARDYAGVHLTVAGYLSAAGTAIPVDNDTATVIAGWAPDETWWLTDTVSLSGDPDSWTMNVNEEGAFWIRDSSSGT